MFGGTATTITALTGTALLLAGCHVHHTEQAADPAGAKAYEYLTELQGIGARPSSSPGETRAADWMADKLGSWGYEVTRQPFTYTPDRPDPDGPPPPELASQNIAVTLPGESADTIVVGAHYDTKGEGSQGATDNGAGVSALLALAEALDDKPLPYTVQLVFFGAEENGLNGSKAYLKALSPEQTGRITAMVNYDTIAGGDQLYVHSALTDPTSYECADPARYSSDPTVRDRLVALSAQGGMTRYRIHPDFPGYPAGETGGWSDHAGFACLGIPVAQVEATNFAINGEDGFDGYSQTVNPALWDCYDAATTTACDRDTETKWGKIWHTGFDRLPELERIFGDRVRSQIDDGTELMMRFLQKPGL